jgi:hypothetical protein
MRLGHLAFAVLVAGCSCGVVIEPDAGAREDATPTHGLIAISTSDATHCALHSDGRAVCWGEAFPEPFVFEAPVDRVSAGANQACVLRGTSIECVSAT